ncbi:hypothetical protein RB195_008736 [Necator americanus]|uniref:Uncharacterized protein n=1 Tax=Necator americanus TaxID=51031 RepID=A0ABR1CRV1_NECAM
MRGADYCNILSLRSLKIERGERSALEKVLAASVELTDQQFRRRINHLTLRGLKIDTRNNCDDKDTRIKRRLFPLSQ